MEWLPARYPFYLPWIERGKCRWMSWEGLQWAFSIPSIMPYHDLTPGCYQFLNWPWMFIIQTILVVETSSFNITISLSSSSQESISSWLTAGSVISSLSPAFMSVCTKASTPAIWLTIILLRVLLQVRLERMPQAQVTTLMSLEARSCTSIWRSGSMSSCMRQIKRDLLEPICSQSTTERSFSTLHTCQHLKIKN